MIMINGERWRVRRVPPSYPVLVHKKGAPAIGCCDDITKTIYISQVLTPSQTRQVLCHEIVHAYMYSYNIMIDDYTEEIVASILDTYGEDIFAHTSLVYDSFK